MNKKFEFVVETNRRQKSLHDFLGANKDVRTIGIISPENPMGVKLSQIENNKRVEKFKFYLHNNKIRYQRVKGRYNNREHSFLLFNVTVSELSFYGQVFDQESFIFGKFLDDDSGNIKFEYYQKEEGDVPYQMLDICDGFIRRDNAENFYTLISKNFKFKIPFSIFESIHNTVEYRKKTSKDYAKKYDYYMNRSLNENLTTQSRVIARSILYDVAWAPYEKRLEMIKEENDYMNEILRLSGCSETDK